MTTSTIRIGKPPSKEFPKTPDIMILGRDEYKRQLIYMSASSSQHHADSRAEPGSKAAEKLAGQVQGDARTGRHTSV